MLGGAMSRMKKTTIYLDPDVDGALARMAAEQELTKGALIRRVLEQATRETRRRRIEAPFS